jgi:hypothetical protein
MLDHGFGAIIALSNNLSLLIVTVIHLKQRGIDPATSCLLAQYSTNRVVPRSINLLRIFVILSF